MPKDKKKLWSNLMKYVLVVLAITFLTLYISQATGYYEYEQHKKVVLTEENIKRFEEDVADGKNIDLENYLEDPSKNYNNKASQLGYQISNQLGTYVKKGIEGVFKILNKLIEDDS